MLPRPLADHLKVHFENPILNGIRDKQQVKMIDLGPIHLDMTIISPQRETVTSVVREVIMPRIVEHPSTW